MSLPVVSLAVTTARSASVISVCLIRCSVGILFIRDSPHPVRLSDLPVLAADDANVGLLRKLLRWWILTATQRRASRDALP